LGCWPVDLPAVGCVTGFALCFAFGCGPVDLPAFACCLTFFASLPNPLDELFEGFDAFVVEDEFTFGVVIARS
jgi:hypothetical protein